MDFIEELKKILGEDNLEKVNEIKALTGKCFVSKDDYKKMTTKNELLETEKNDLQDKLDTVKDEKLPEQTALEKKVTALEKQLQDQAKKTNNEIAKNILISAGIKVEGEDGDGDFETLVSTLVKETEEETKKTVEAFVNISKKQNAAIIQKTKEELMKQTPNPSKGGEGDGTVSKEQFKNMSVYDKAKLYQENKDLYTSLVNE